MERYLQIPDFQQRKYISKLRCSDHVLEIEKGRHKRGNTRTRREERICTLCNNGEVEDEEHFLLKCDRYNSLRIKHKIEHFNEASAFFTEENLSTLGNYLSEAFKLRDDIVQNCGGIIEGLGGEGVGGS